ncbi:glycosyltransferase family A protein [Erythrobacteraceae bacterium WH01K]|nr:glycosyltransferase family A protein [Erythrobacteraceae bacterium WH01K]
MGTHSPTNDAEMTVAIVVTAYNHARFLSDALGSIAAQTLSPAEVVVIDDGSHDAPEKVSRDYDFVRLVRTENRGLAAARNRGLAEIETDAAVFLDADDILYPEALRTGRGGMESGNQRACMERPARYSCASCME